MREKAEITFEVEETFVLKQGGKLIYDLCPRCGQTVGMISPELLAKFEGTSEREIFRLLEAGLIHFIEVERVLVCLGCYQRGLIGDGTGMVTGAA
ncbi:MAG TPA: hypothetical protein VEV84_03475 [Pyrinomonadaceae bacterium]|jgi:hypothetical protein|nr:hypothetical protein [Pyrinomonadaceae bacterium]